MDSVVTPLEAAHGPTAHRVGSTARSSVDQCSFVSAILGHSTMRVTERYAAVVPELHEAVAAAMDRALGT